VRQEAGRACSKRLRSQRLKRLVEGDLELACLRVTNAERSSTDAPASADRNILHLLQVSLKVKRKKRELAYVFLALFEFPHLFLSLLL
jgi:hypothetical protein